MKSISLIYIITIITIITTITNCNEIKNKSQNKQTLLQKLHINRKQENKKNQTPKNNNKINQQNIKNYQTNNIKQNPQFKKIITNTPNKVLPKKYLRNLSSPELNLLRAKIYQKYNYNFYSLWGQNFYKEKYGYIIKPKQNFYRKLNKQDKINEQNIVKQLKINYKTKKTSLPIYIGHILREINYNKAKQKYFQNIDDAKPLPPPFNKTNSGIVKPILKNEINKTNWFNLVNGKKRFIELNIPFDKERLYLVFYYYKNNIKYIISYEAFFGQIGPQDIKNFSIYNRKGLLKRNIFIDNQETYEKDYFYNKKQNLYKIVEKIIQKNSFIKVNVYKLN